MLWKLWPLLGSAGASFSASCPLMEDGSGREEALASYFPVSPRARVSGVMERFKHRFHMRCSDPPHPEG